MDSLIQRFDAVQDDDLFLVQHRGIAYQSNMDRLIEYGDRYFEHYRLLEDSPIGAALNAGRCAMIARHSSAGATVVDIGAGSGSFVRAARSCGFRASGTDVNPMTIKVLSEMGCHETRPDDYEVVTFWDSLEHIPNPDNVFRHIKHGAVVCVAIPIMKNLLEIRSSKHYKPGEHLYYFTEQGFIDWMACWGFRLLETSTHEVDSGRDSIGAYAFKKDLPSFHEHVLAYKEMHSTRFYGSSATELHLEKVAKVVADLKPRSIMDYGCGRSDLSSHFWLDGQRQIVKYDPAIPMYKRMPSGTYDLVLCCDVMEHIPIDSVDRVLSEVRSKGGKAFFTISLKLARAKLPDGRNAHVTLLTKTEWMRWIKSKYRKVREIPNEPYPMELVLLAET